MELNIPIIRKLGENTFLVEQEYLDTLRMFGANDGLLINAGSNTTVVNLYNADTGKTMILTSAANYKPV